MLSLWVAVNFDIIRKIRELAASGDGQARSEIDQLDGWIQAGDVSRLQAFEAGILQRAQDAYEFLSPTEAEHLKRLREDRHRCAHPALTLDGALYEPSPEQIRAYLVAATRALFTHPPVQGRSALAQLKAEVAGPAFPLDADQVAVYLGAKYLDRGKDVLVSQIVKLYLQQALATTPDVPRLRSRQVLMAAKARRFDLYQAAMAEAWPTRVAAADAAALPHVIELLGLDPELWPRVSDADRIRLGAFIQQVPASPAAALLDALRVPALHTLARARLAALPADELSQLLLVHPRQDLVSLTLERLEQVNALRDVGPLLDGIRALVPHLSEGDLRRALRAAETNDQIYSSYSAPPRLRQLFLATAAPWPHLASEWGRLVQDRPEFGVVKAELQALNWLPAAAPEEPNEATA
ncbi:hypothetical protein [Deinococcus multiflagellatus]|uniref:Uncharacterized protein n=1 Tax=Deinococcus multiflagellatus TaxID=1656887 RepID=A0ABW1ZNG5_9DEIO